MYRLARLHRSSKMSHRCTTTATTSAPTRRRLSASTWDARNMPESTPGKDHNPGQNLRAPYQILFQSKMLKYKIQSFVFILVIYPVNVYNTSNKLSSSQYQATNLTVSHITGITNLARSWWTSSRSTRSYACARASTTSRSTSTPRRSVILWRCLFDVIAV